MTGHEAYLLGYIYGMVDVRLPDKEADHSGKRFGDAGARPLIGMADVINRAIRAKVMTEELNRKIAELSSGISEETATGTSTAPIPLPLTGNWQFGYFAARGEHYAETKEAAEIRYIRARLYMSQQAFADAIGSTQAEVSRWEQGKVIPTAATMDKIRALVD